MVLRQEIEGPRSKQLEFVFCGLIPQDKNSKNAEGWRLGPAHIEDERPHISHSLSQEPCMYSVHFSRSVVSNSLQPHGPQHTRLPCPSPTPGACSNSCLSSRWCYPTISSSVILFSCLQSFPASGSSAVSQFFASAGQSIGVSASASVLLMNIQDWFPLGLTD